MKTSPTIDFPPGLVIALVTPAVSVTRQSLRRRIAQTRVLGFTPAAVSHTKSGRAIVHARLWADFAAEAKRGGHASCGTTLPAKSALFTATATQTSTRRHDNPVPIATANGQLAQADDLPVAAAESALACSVISTVSGRRIEPRSAISDVAVYLSLPPQR